MTELFPQPVTPNNATLYTRLRMMSVEGHHFDVVLTLVWPWCTCVRKALRIKVLSKQVGSNEPGIDEWQVAYGNSITTASQVVTAPIGKLE